jgi:fructose-1,6-bisphosphatase/inositol monophosphatase family enzyme
MTGILDALDAAVRTNLNILQSHYGSLQRADKAAGNEMKSVATVGEKEFELAVRKQLEANGLPFYGEETGTASELAKGTFVCLDPIDGTMAMINASSGKPNQGFGICIAWVEGGNPKESIIYNLKPTADNKSLEIVSVFRSDTTYPKTSDKPSELISCTAPSLMFPNEPRELFWDNQNCTGYTRLITGEVKLVHESKLDYTDIAAVIPLLDKHNISYFYKKEKGGTYAIIAGDKNALPERWAEMQKPSSFCCRAFAAFKNLIKPKGER